MEGKLEGKSGEKIHRFNQSIEPGVWKNHPHGELSMEDPDRQIAGEVCLFSRTEWKAIYPTKITRTKIKCAVTQHLTY